jgi:hypothetical protein
MKNIKWATNVKKQGSRTRNLYAREKKELNRITGEIEKWNPRRQRENEKMISSRSSEETPLQSIKKTNRFPASNRG